MVSAALNIRNALKRHTAGDSVFELLVPQFSLHAGEVCVVAGRSGCGKTTLMDVLGCISGFEYCGLFELCVGERVLNLANASDRMRAAVRREQIGYVLQQGGLLPFLSAGDNIMLPVQMQRKKVNREQLLRLARNLGIEDQLCKFPSALSIGQRQRICIARALITTPRLLLADEPTGALDPLSAQEVKKLLIRTAAQTGCSVIIVTHDTELFADVADTVLSFDVEKDEGVTRSVLRQNSAIERSIPC